MFIPFNYLPVFGQAHGMSTDMANYLIAVLNAASVFGRLSGGLGDKFGRFNCALFMVCSLAALTGDPIGGALLSKYDGGFRGLQIFTGCVIMAGVVVFTIARFKLAGASLRTVV
jgi:MFS family permease